MNGEREHHTHTDTCSMEWVDSNGNLHVTTWCADTYRDENEPTNVVTMEEVRFERGRGLFENNPGGV